MKKEKLNYQIKICNWKVVNNHLGTHFFTKDRGNCKTLKNHLAQEIKLTCHHAYFSPYLRYADLLMLPCSKD